jgi:predicted O-linked N-acetylglucosamine transferase (SPINDLY family)
MASADAFVEVHDLHDVAVADRARALEIDIAIDLKGVTHGARPGIFAARAAPLQVNYLGYPGSLGLPWWDYLVADAAVVPADAYGQYSEKIASLPHSYQPNDRARVHPDETPARAALGLPPHAVVLACFNAHYKIGPEVFACWMAILRQVPNAVLWLLQGHPQAQANLQAAARSAGIDPCRLVFAPQLPQAAHLARLPQADFMLDTWPCNAHTTASDALWMGVPVWTLVGRSFAARVAASLLQAAGLPEWMCSTQADYVQGAIDLALCPPRVQTARLRLAQTRWQSPLFDTVRYTRSLEAAFKAMAERQRAGLAPAHFQVQEPG